MRAFATWNSERDLWETDQGDLLCEHLDVYSETFPTSGMTANGEAYALPTWEPRTDGSGSSSLLLKTPTSQLAVNGGSQHLDKRKLGGHGPTLADEIEHLLPTPTVGNATGGNATRSGARKHELLLPGVAMSLLPTPRAQNGEERNQNSWARDPSQPQNLENALTKTLPGANMSQPSGAGNQLWEDVPLPLQSPQGAMADTDSAPVSPNG